VQFRGLIAKRRSGLLDPLSVARPRDRAAWTAGGRHKLDHIGTPVQAY